jgi:3'-phosphoadenosine 5'-phosphosulfate (PAPS) 3'-phosphatase
VTIRVSRQLDSFDRDTQFTVQTVRDSIRLARSLEGRAQASIKSDTSPVTVADLSIQAIAAARLSGAFPQDSLIAEEDARLLRADPDLSRQVTEVVRQSSRTPRSDGSWHGSAMAVQASRLLDAGPSTRSTAPKAFYTVANTSSRSR